MGGISYFVVKIGSTFKI